MLKKILSLMGLLGIFLAGTPAFAQKTDFFVEIFLAQEKQADVDAIRKAFAEHSTTRIHPQFFRIGYPPPNIAIGSQVPADVARLAIALATKYNRGITHLLPQFRFFPGQIAIGTSAFDERVPVPIKPEDLERLRDPNLDDTTFHTLYRQLTGEKPKKEALSHSEWVN